MVKGRVFNALRPQKLRSRSKRYETLRVFIGQSSAAGYSIPKNFPQGRGLM
jgi:hypothetical protein